MLFFQHFLLFAQSPLFLPSVHSLTNRWVGTLVANYVGCDPSTSDKHYNHQNDDCSDDTSSESATRTWFFSDIVLFVRILFCRSSLFYFFCFLIIPILFSTCSLSFSIVTCLFRVWVYNCLASRARFSTIVESIIVTPIIFIILLSNNLFLIFVFRCIFDISEGYDTVIIVASWIIDDFNRILVLIFYISIRIWYIIICLVGLIIEDI